MPNEHEGLIVPKKRDSCTYELVIQSVETGRFKLYLAVGKDATGRPIEIWLDCAKEGTMLREFMHAWAALFSTALQHRIPLGHLVKLYKEWGFQPAGRVEGFEKIKSCESVLSLVVSVLEMEFPNEMPAPKEQKDLFSK